MQRESEILNFSGQLTLRDSFVSGIILVTSDNNHVVAQYMKYSDYYFCFIIIIYALEIRNEIQESLSQTHPICHLENGEAEGFKQYF